MSKEFPLMDMLVPSGFKRRSKSNQNLTIENPLQFKKEVDENSQEGRTREEKSLE